MRHIIFVFSLCLSLSMANAQVITKEELKEYTKENNESSVDKAKELSEKYKLDENGDLVITDTIDCPGVASKDLFYKISEWMLTMSPEASSAMQTFGKNAILTDLFLPNIARRNSGEHIYNVSIYPQILFKFEDNKVYLTYSLHAYKVLKKSDDEFVSFGSFFIIGGSKKKFKEWYVKDCYPFAKGSGKYPKIISSRAMLNSIACYELLRKKIIEVVTRPM
ncbi:MAG: hypothetical protein IKX61_01160 [Prevotella sp.]|nr:hypothetical protein [Prevotella sp.]